MIRIVCTAIESDDPRIYNELYRRASADRRLRADRYRRQEDKLRCVTADALLRRALGTDCYQIQKGKNGKPYVEDRPDFHYNLSHSGRYVVIAWGNTEVGIDVQQHDATADLEGIGACFFTSDEIIYIREDANKRTERFYEIWTKKESCLKYTGEGLRRNMRSFSTLTPEHPIRYWYRKPDADHSLCLYAVDQEITFELLDIRQLL